MKYFLFLITIFLFCSYSFANDLSNEAFSSEQGAASIPACSNASFDSDGDGWGWENQRSCKVGGPVYTSKHPICASLDSDSDGDGWGWENNQSCKVLANDSESMENADSSIAPATSEASSINSSLLNNSNADENDLVTLNLLSLPDHAVSQSNAEISFSFSDFSQA